MPSPGSALDNPWAIWSGPVSVMALGLLTWIMQGRLSAEVKKALMDRITSQDLRIDEKERRLEQKLDLLTNQIKDNVQAVGAKVDSSASGTTIEVNEIKREIREILVANSSTNAILQAGFQNMEKMLSLHIRAEVAQQLSRSAGQSGD